MPGGGFQVEGESGSKYMKGERNFSEGVKSGGGSALTRGQISKLSIKKYDKPLRIKGEKYSKSAQQGGF